MNIKRMTALLLMLAALAALISGCGAKQGGDPGQSADATQAADVTQAADIAENTPEAQNTPAPAERDYLVHVGTSFREGAGAAFETDDSYYYVVRSAFEEYRIMFTDKQYKDWMPLCGKPDCSHRDNNCNALLDGGAGGAWLYGQYIYYCPKSDNIHMPQLWRMRLDGSGHECIYEGGEVELEIDEGYTGMSSGQSIQFDGGRVYVTIVVTPHYPGEIEGEETTYFRCFMLELDSPGEPQRMRFTKEDGEPFENFSIAASDGRYFYVNDGGILGYETVITDKYGPEMEIQEPVYGCSSVYRFDTVSLKAEKLCELPCYAFNPPVLYNGRLYYALGYLVGYLLSVDTASGEVEVLNTCEPGEELWHVFCGGYVLGTRLSSDDGEAGTFVYDTNGVLLQTIPYEACGEDLRILYVSGNIAFGVRTTLDVYDEQTIQYPVKHPPVWYLDLSDIGTDELMWKKWEP